MDNARRSHFVGKLIIAGALPALSLISVPASATVYEIGDDGVATVCNGGGRSAQGCVPHGTSVAEEVPDVPAAAVTIVAEPAVPVAYRAPLLDVSKRYDLSPRLMAALTSRESAWRASATSPKGAIGLTQLMPATARALAVDPRDPAANLAGGAHYLRQLLDQFDGDVERALAAYNAGPGRVLRARGVPQIPETRAYVASIVDGLDALATSEGRR